MHLGKLFQRACQANVQSAPELLNYSQGPFTNPTPPLETAQEVREMQQGEDVLMMMMSPCSREPDKGTRDRTMGLAVVIHRSAGSVGLKEANVLATAGNHQLGMQISVIITSEAYQLKFQCLALLNNLLNMFAFIFIFLQPELTITKRKKKKFG